MMRIPPRHRLPGLPVIYSRLPLILALLLAAPARGETGAKPEANTEALKYEAIELISRLNRLEEQLLYPAHTRVSVFVSVAGNSQASAHSISIAIDDNKVTDHIYTEKEINALNSGGIQRLYTGNTLMGKHTLRVNFRHSQKDGTVVTHEAQYRFDKDENAENIEIIVSGGKPYLVIQSRN